MYIYMYIYVYICMIYLYEYIFDHLCDLREFVSTHVILVPVRVLERQCWSVQQAVLVSTAGYSVGRY